MIEATKMTKEDLQEVAGESIGPDANYASADQPATTVRKDGQIIVVGGINWYWDGVGEAWCILHKRSMSCPFTTYRAIKMVFQGLTKDKFQRVQATVRTNWPEAIKMTEKLGFKREGLLRKYCPDGADVYMYAVTT